MDDANDYIEELEGRPGDIAGIATEDEEESTDRYDDLDEAA